MLFVWDGVGGVGDGNVRCYVILLSLMFVWDGVGGVGDGNVRCYVILLSLMFVSPCFCAHVLHTLHCRYQRCSMKFCFHLKPSPFPYVLSPDKTFTVMLTIVFQASCCRAFGMTFTNASSFSRRVPRGVLWVVVKHCLSLYFLKDQGLLKMDRFPFSSEGRLSFRR